MPNMRFQPCSLAITARVAPMRRITSGWKVKGAVFDRSTSGGRCSAYRNPTAEGHRQPPPNSPPASLPSVRSPCKSRLSVESCAPAPMDARRMREWSSMTRNRHPSDGAHRRVSGRSGLQSADGASPRGVYAAAAAGEPSHGSPPLAHSWGDRIPSQRPQLCQRAACTKSRYLRVFSRFRPAHHDPTAAPKPQASAHATQMIGWSSSLKRPELHPRSPAAAAWSSATATAPLRGAAPSGRCCPRAGSR